MKPRSDDIVQRFWEKVNKDGPYPEYRQDLGNCWLWHKKDPKGYGRFYPNNGHIMAHRFSYICAKGLIPEGMVIDHLCRVRNCVNPNHLEAVTDRENCIRGVGPTAHNSKKQTCECGLKFTKRKDGGRECKPCLSIRRKEYYKNRGKHLLNLRRNTVS